MIRAGAVAMNEPSKDFLPHPAFTLDQNAGSVRS
jgi:hypothetical protein